MLEALKNAGQRSHDYMYRYGVDMTWQLDLGGLRLEAFYGSDSVEKYIFWSDLKCENPDAVLLHYEESALKGLSS